ncbi:peptidoglycan recognition protein 1-like [Macrosteles quadrilineatus]|uniref:peptidoglycan recognition protein 1-like n=1 Tax=Macrosteles quadrilineatus TaxID=74068 RepID=UPI0023E10DA5|nr:peptidoglycan recognition protein 1-like [Macrosteles quadrilineatus]
MEVVSRAQWRARCPKSSTYLELPVSRVFYAHTNTSPCSCPDTCADECRRLQNQHRIVLQDIRFNFLVGGDGLVYEGRGWESCPSLDHGYADFEEYSIYIGCIGKQTTFNNDELFFVLQEFVNMAVGMKYITEDYNLEFIET